jgi:hypothetical protein
MWLTNDQGACEWPGASHPELANVVKVVHYGWHHLHSKSLPEGVRRLPNKVGQQTSKRIVSLFYIIICFLHKILYLIMLIYDDVYHFFI